MGDLLKEAIADAKAVRETALQNAKMALEEAFTPQLKSMLSAKLKEDEFGGDEEEIAPEEGDEFGGEEEIPAEVPAEEGDYMEDEEMSDEIPAEEGEMDDMGGEEDVVEINGVKYAPVVSEEDDMGDEEEIEVEDDNLDLESIIRELESELSEGEEEEETVEEQDDAYSDKADSTDSSHLAEQDDAYDEDVEGDEKSEHGVGTPMGENATYDVDSSIFTEDEDEDDDDDDELDEQSGSSNIGSGDNKVSYASASDEEDPGNSTDVEALGEQLKEYKIAVKFLKDKLHEVNILNAKLLFTNKLFKEFALNNNQKLKVVETFDRTQSTREIKLVYSTLCEQFSDNGSIKNRKSINESASSAVGSTKPSQKSRKVIGEEDVVANRFKKLAGIING